MKEDRISGEFVDRVLELVKKTHEEIVKLAGDYMEVKKSLGKTPTYFEYLEVCDNLVITFIDNLTSFQTTMRAMHIKRMAEREKQK